MKQQSKQQSQQNKEKQFEQGRVIAQGMRAEQVQHEKNMAKSEKRTNTMLENQARQALSGGVQPSGSRN